MRKSASLYCVIAVLLTATGISVQGAPVPKTTGSGGKIVRADDTAAKRDAAVIEAALNHLLSVSKRANPVEAWNSPKGGLYFYLPLRPLPYPFGVNAVLHPEDANEWKGLTPEQHRRMWEAARDLVRRVKATEAPKPFTPASRRLIRMDRHEATARLKARLSFNPKKSKYYRQVFGMFPPGYSPDGRYAVAFVDFPWSGYHSGDATYVLIRQGERWKVLSRQLRIYP